MEERISQVTPDKARKRVQRKETWKVNVSKKLRYSRKQLPIYPTCNHKTKAFKCASLTMKDCIEFQEIFYKIQGKINQDSFLLKYCQTESIKRRRTQNAKNKKKSFQTKFFIRTTKNNLLPVCQTTFLGILGISRWRVQYVVKKFFETGSTPKEYRGGDHKSFKYKEKKEAVIEFISKLKVVDTHYCRSATSVRKYLPSELSINKLGTMYNNAQGTESNLKVKPKYFRSVFNLNFNLGFGTPRTDMCSKCIEYTEKLKNENDEKIKKDLMTEKRVHILPSKEFFSLLKDDASHIIIFSFNCQKNLSLPKVPDQQAYYSRQLYLYNFTIVIGTSKSELNSKNCFSYCWTENQFYKGSNEIASAVYDRLCKTNLDGKEIVQLVADGCGGQNKNTTMIAMCCFWLLSAPKNVKVLELNFPIVGHSYIPPDRIFGNIEKRLRKLEVIVDPESYLSVIAQHASVIKLGTECEVLNWKSEAQSVLKPPGNWHFKFSVTKRFFLTRSVNGKKILIRGEPHYYNQIGVPKPVTKKLKTINMIKPNKIKINECFIKDLKLKDVDSLLQKHYGDNWKDKPELIFYSKILSLNQSSDEGDRDDLICQRVDEIGDLIV